MENSVITQMLPFDFKQPTIQELIDQLEAIELFYKNNPGIKEQRIVDYITRTPMKTDYRDEAMNKLLAELKSQSAHLRINFISSKFAR